MGVGSSVARWLRDRGHDAVHLLDQGLERLPDEQIVEKARREGRVVLTFDLEFGAIAVASSAALPSVVIFRLEDARPANVIEHVARILVEAGGKLEEGAIVSVREGGFRVRELPIE